ncbi:MAG: spore coat associated protein CotJA [Clostridia bacterium]|nr:spore coat associated protein CotJA [Clostridia bacterium]
MNRTNYYGMRGRPMPARAVPTVDTPPPACDVLMVVAHVEPQVFGETYGVDDAFVNGTLYPELNKPLGGVCRG